MKNIFRILTVTVTVVVSVSICLIGVAMAGPVGLFGGLVVSSLIGQHVAREMI
jgi:hypothetical protein